jgi:hypothetical protein
MASPMVSKLRNDLASMKMKYSGALRRARSNPKVAKSTDLALQIGGSAIAGYVSTSQFNKVAGFETPLIAGVGLVGLHMFGKKNQVNHYAGLLGIGMLNGYVYQKVQEQRGMVMVSADELQTILNQSNIAS